MSQTLICGECRKPFTTKGQNALVTVDNGTGDKPLCSHKCAIKALERPNTRDPVLAPAGQDEVEEDE